MGTGTTTTDNSQEIARLQGEQSQASAQLSNAEAELAAIKRKLERLRAAKTKVADEKNELYAIQCGEANSLANVAYYGMGILGAKWAGQKFSSYSEQVFQNLHLELNQYVKDVDDALDAICDKITQLENQEYEKNGVIGYLQSWLNSIGNEIAKFFN